MDDHRLGAVIAMGSRSSVHEWVGGIVAKVPKPSTPEGWIRFEAAYVSAVQRIGVAVPVFHGFASVGGRDVALYERINGESMWESLRNEPGRAGELGSQLASVHASLLGLVGPMALPSQHSRLRSKIRAAVQQSGSPTDADLTALPDGEMMLCHGDLHPKNILMAKNGPVVIDWFDACRGSAAADVARTRVLLRGSRDEVNPDHLRGISAPTIARFQATYLDQVLSITGLPVSSVDRWIPAQEAAQRGEQ